MSFQGPFNGTFQWPSHIQQIQLCKSDGTSSGSTPALIIAVLIHRDTPSPCAKRKRRLTQKNQMTDLHRHKVTHCILQIALPFPKHAKSNSFETQTCRHSGLRLHRLCRNFYRNFLDISWYGVWEDYYKENNVKLSWMKMHHALAFGCGAVISYASVV